MINITRIMNLNDPKQAREFLSDLWINAAKVEFVETAESGIVYFDKCTDEQAVDFAHQFYEMLKVRR